MRRSVVSRASDNAGGIRAKIDRERRKIMRELAKEDAFAAMHDRSALLDPDFDTLDILGSLST